MGTWGEGLYDDDEACDVRDTLSLLAKMPAGAEQILALLLKQFGRNEDLRDDGCPGFWIAVADQFARHGIESGRALTMARRAIDSGADIDDLQARGMEAGGLKARQKVHQKVLQRLAQPKPASSRKVPKNAPVMTVQAGEVYAFPTMKGKGMNAWFPDWEKAGFQPDGWGALIILATGRVFDWFPWAAYSPVNVNPHSAPVLEDVLRGKTLFKDGVSYCAPKASHLKKMGMTLLGKLQLDDNAVDALCKLASVKPRSAVLCDWSVCSGAFSTHDPRLGRASVQELVAV
ncbi:hypothetical protein GM658_27095 [Pseudoduganella eburnea]|uniref:DUF4259 domain-containing protein n=1 Tax=Massilia eburnea TaxID=1776165 RepID=A0A6L6QPE3_9BURK|nr:hypothetical protein [Massilia eburnea]MTW14288.1 hypothetical protein [Massilia eburnea]